MSTETVQPTAERSTWRDYTVENYGEGTYDTCVVCRSDGGCEWLRSNADGRYLTLGEAVDAAKEHVAWHARQELEEHDHQLAAPSETPEANHG